MSSYVSMTRLSTQNKRKTRNLYLSLMSLKCYVFWKRMRRYCRTRGKPLWTRANHTHQNPWQITRANNTTHLYNPTLPTKSPPIFTPFFLVVCVWSNPHVPSQRANPFFFGVAVNPPPPLNISLTKRGVERTIIATTHALACWLAYQTINEGGGI